MIEWKHLIIIDNKVLIPWNFSENFFNFIWVKCDCKSFKVLKFNLVTWTLQQS